MSNTHAGKRIPMTRLSVGGHYFSVHATQSGGEKLEQLDFAGNHAVLQQALRDQRFIVANLISTMLFGVIQSLIRMLKHGIRQHVQCHF